MLTCWTSSHQLAHPGTAGTLKGPSDVGTGRIEDEQVLLVFISGRDSCDAIQLGFRSSM